MKFNKEFAKEIYEIRQKQLKRRSKEKSLVAWVEDHRLRSGKGKALVFILPTIGCSWALSKSGGCSICGYLYDNPQNVNFESMISKFEKTVSTKITSDSIYSVKLFTSGSILDKREMPDEILQKMLRILKEYDQIKEIVLESRPEYVTNKKLDLISQSISAEKIEIAIGLESANDEILRKSINKGFYWANFEKATKKVLNKGMKVKAYLIFKPPFVSEYDSIVDTISSAEKCIKLGVDTISINAVAIHRGTYLNVLFEKKNYRTPWLWSLIHICKEIKMKFPEVRIICEPVSGGNERGAHNCGLCDKSLIKMLKEFTLSQNINTLNMKTKCECHKEWKSYLIHEKIELGEPHAILN